MENLVEKTVSVTRCVAVGVAATCLLMPNVVMAASSDQIVMHIDGSVAIVFAIILAIILALLLYPRIKQRTQSASGSNDALLVRASEIADSPAAGAPVALRGPDMDRRQRNEELLASYIESDQLYAAVVRSANDAIITKTLDGKITGWNPGAERLFGYAAAEVIGKPIDIIIPPDRRGDLRHILGRIAQGEYIDHYETVRIAKDGRALDVSLSISPVKSATGDIIGAAKIARDMTEQKKLRAQLLQAQKMEAVGLMAGGVAHDFNNLLLVMMIHAEMLRDDCEPSDPRLPGVVEIVQSIERARGLTRQLLAFSRKKPTETSAINLGEIVAGVHSMLRRVLPANIEIVTLAGDNVRPVCADRGEIEQVLMNLAVNARDAMPNGGRFGIEIENCVIAGPEYDLPSGDYVAMRVSDSGIGIEAENLDKIFDPFFTTKERGRGTGLGLSLCYGIIAQAGGSLTVDSKPGLGTTFLVLLPRATREARDAAVPSEQPLAKAPGGRETILVVEDDQAVMRATVVTLKRSGYTVLTAANGDEARRLIYGRNEPLDLVLSDVVMPQLGGPELARHLAEVRPDLPVVFMTGYSDYPITGDNGDNRIENRRAIMKPFHPRDLLSTIREVLDVRPERPGL